MGNIKNWSVIICCVTTICVLTQMLFPPGKIQKSMNMVLSLFVVCTVFGTLFSKSNFLNFSPKNKFKTKIPTTKFEHNDFLNLQIKETASENIKFAVSQLLKKNNVVPKKIEIFMDTNKDNCIVIVRCKIYLDKKYDAPKIKKEVENQMNISTEIIDA